MDWNRLLSRARLGVSRQRHDSEARTDFQRDFDRIVFSSAFRRLQDKTQVFPLSQSDYVRTRLTHSLEVSSVGRSLGTMVGDSVIRRHRLQGVYPQDFGAVVAAACLAHDIGNPPFGHAGEDAIRFWFTASATGRAVLEPLTEAQRQDFLRFEGNAQGFRIITRLQSPDNPGGMQLTCATLGAFTKYPRASALPTDPPPGIAFKKFGFYQDDQDLFA
ncbi:MAG: dNTP triphosphohydrolase, partial [Candidatus Contendobacter sp.]|nr:dNTP triphosphohydrolase [Candidatus Contendobacter sp.]